MRRLAVVCALVASVACIQWGDLEEQSRQKRCETVPTDPGCVDGGGLAGGTGGGLGGGSGGGSAPGGGSVTGGGQGGGAGGDFDAGVCGAMDGGCKLARPLDGGADAGFDAGSFAGTSWYVSATGKDDAGGQLGAPLATLERALFLASPGEQIRICQGVFPTHAVVSKTVSIAGGYDCASGARLPGTEWVGPDGGPDSGYLVTLISRGGNDGGACDAFVLKTSGAGVAPVIDGLRIVGLDAGCTDLGDPSWALRIDDSSRPTVTNCEILGGSGSGGTFYMGSTAVAILGHASPVLAFNRISGGAGTSTGREGSMAVLFDRSPGGATLHDNVISGGSGTGSGTIGMGSGAGSLGVGLYSDCDQPPVITHNWISGGAGRTANAVSGGGSVGVYLARVLTAPVTLSDNFIEGGSGLGIIGAMAVYDDSQGPFLLLRNSIYGGDSTARVFAVVADGAGAQVDIANNMIHAGNRAGGANTIGLRLSGVRGTVAHNTIVYENNASAALFAGRSLGGAAVTLRDITFQNNLLLGTNAANPGVDITFTPDAGALTPDAGAFARFAANGFAASSGLLVRVGDAGFPTLAGFEAAFPAVADGNLALSTTCAGGASIACSGDTCVTGVIEWDPTDRGYGALWSRAGWRLSPTTPCQVRDSTVDDTAATPLDYHGKPRASPPSMGASERLCSCR